VYGRAATRTASSSKRKGERILRAVMQPTPHSELSLGMSLCAVLRPSLTPVRSLTVTGISPSALFIPTTIRPSFAGVSSTGSHIVSQSKVIVERDDLRADPLPVLNTRSMGQPQFMSTKSIPLANSLPRTSAVGTIVEGLLPASWTPKMYSDGCRRTRDHSSREEVRKEVARPTSVHATV